MGPRQSAVFALPGALSTVAGADAVTGKPGMDAARRVRDFFKSLRARLALNGLVAELRGAPKNAGLLEDEMLLTVVDGHKLLLEVLEKLNHTKSALLVAHGENRNLELASRNVQGVTLAAPNVLQPYDVLKHDLLVLSKDAVTRLSHSLDPEKKPVVVPDVETIAPAAKPGKKEAAPKAAAKKPAAAKKAAKPVKKKGKG